MPSFASRALVALAACHCLALAFGAQQLPLGLNLLMRSGDKPSPTSTPFGQLLTWDGKPIYIQQEAKDAPKPNNTLAPVMVVTKELDISNNPDFQGMVKSPDGKLYLFSHFEASRPSALYLSELSQDKATGKLTAMSTKLVNMSSWGGIWTPCAGSITPWGSYLGGEEYEPDARLLETATSLGANDSTSLYAMDSENTWPNVVEFMRYYDLYADKLTIQDVQKNFNPYLYGHAVEGTVGNGGAPNVTKWYTLGRSSMELAYVMPDNKTTYITDDGTNVGFFKFVADKPGDLSSGSLYAAKFDQISDEDGGSWEISWVLLGKANQKELQDKAKSLKFSDMMEYSKPSKDGSCPAGFTSVNSGDRLHECLRVKPGQEKWAAFFETRRYGAMLGATTEWSKWEGLTFSPSRSKIYTAMTEIRYGMEDNKKKGENSTAYDIGGPNDVRLPYSKCGCVYELDVDGSYDTTTMTALVCGTSKGSGVDEQNPCSVDSIAGPDNVSIMDEHDILIIGEDTSLHQNDFIWAYNLETNNLTRIATTPFGAESTAPYVYPNVNGWTYITAAAQHPYGESDTAYLTNPSSEGKPGYVSYFAVKSADIAGKQIQFAAVPVPRTNATKSQFVGSAAITVY